MNPGNNHAINLHDLDANIVLGGAKAEVIRGKLDKGLAHAQAKDNGDVLMPDSIEGVTADALEKGDVDRVLAGMTSLVGARLMDSVADAGSMRLDALRAIKAWRAEHQAEIDALRLESPAYSKSVKGMSEKLDALNGKNFKSMDEVTAVWLKLRLDLDKHNTRFVSENDGHRSINETPIREVRMSLNDRPFVIQLFKVGAKKELGVGIKNVEGVGLTRDQMLDVRYGKVEKAA
ncbi:MAG: hypothetical protein US89_C0007G0043 [Candidatus Peregrinibacteria bacterium GW2011_GWF2_38_29]|nr:MAG: hypothetical protein US89_C0007G0043 [Candidatus Peregrinibacteria bacterium GW2011_GWF2_38_29]HBB02859.1 hypothetical protein [Candidatus Peregrinibacteria bacterium]